MERGEGNEEPRKLFAAQSIEAVGVRGTGCIALLLGIGALAASDSNGGIVLALVGILFVGLARLAQVERDRRERGGS